jgi:hypothetical protein
MTAAQLRRALNLFAVFGFAALALTANVVDPQSVRSLLLLVLAALALLSLGLQHVVELLEDLRDRTPDVEFHFEVRRGLDCELGIPHGD